MFRVYYKNDSNFRDDVNEPNLECNYNQVAQFDFEFIEERLSNDFGRFETFDLIFKLLNHGSGQSILPKWLIMRSLSVGDLIGYGLDVRNQQLWSVASVGFRRIRRRSHLESNRVVEKQSNLETSSY